MDFETISRRESRKRRRLSERRRLFSNSLGQKSSQMSLTTTQDNANGGGGGGDYQPIARSDSPIGGDQQRIAMKIQFHITVAPDNEPLILDASICAKTSSISGIGSGRGGLQQGANPPTPATGSSIGEQIQEKLNLSRQNSSNNSTRHRQQRLLAMHNSTTSTSGGSSLADTPLSQTPDDGVATQSDDNLARRRDSRQVAGGESPLATGQLPPMGARSSTITGGMADEATVRFLERAQQPIVAGARLEQAAPMGPRPERYNSAANLSTGTSQQMDRERIYFKRDGQRFGHEFTLKLAVERTYRCLIKVRPLIPLQSISIHGHQLLFVDCSQQQPTDNSASGSGAGGSAPSSRAGSALALNQRLRSGSAVMAAVSSRHSSQPVNDAYLNKHHLRNHTSHHQQSHAHNNNNHHNHHNHHHHHNHNHNHHNQSQNNPRSHPINRPGLFHAQTTGSLYGPSMEQPPSRLLQLAESRSLYCQQQSQMMRHFAASYCSSSNSHLGNQLIYMFDWPAGRFEVNKNKNRTQVQTVLKFRNGQILSLPLQVKFYQSDCRQHLEWGSQLHFIDYDCKIDQLGQMSVDRIQYY